MTTNPEPSQAATKPCPFCGGRSTAYNAFPSFDQGWVVDTEHGDDCPMRGWEGYCHATEAEAITAWNTRFEAQTEARVVAEVVAWLRDMAECCASAVAIGASPERADAFGYAADALERREYSQGRDVR